jgi:hypothetical protein
MSAGPYGWGGCGGRGGVGLGAGVGACVGPFPSLCPRSFSCCNGWCVCCRRVVAGQDYRRTMLGDKMRPAPEREVVLLLRPFVQFSSKEDHDILQRSLLDEVRLRKRIAQLQGYLAEGLRTRADIDNYEAKKRRKG